MMRFLLLMVVCLGGLFRTGGVWAQEHILNIQYYDEDKGLNVTDILDLCQDREGFLWLGTREGLVRYDGYTFRYFSHQPGDSTSISSNHIYCITEDRKGNLWLGLVRGGISCYNRKTGRFTNYRFTDQLKIKTTTVTALFFDKNDQLWIGTKGYGLIRFSPHTKELKVHQLVTLQTSPYLSPAEIPYKNSVYDIWEDEKGVLWCATTDDLYTLDPATETITPHRLEKIAKDGFRQNQAYTLFPEGDLLWVSGWGSGLRSYHRKTGVWKQFLFVPNGLPADAVNTTSHITRKSKDELWVSSADRGLCIFNTRTEQFSFPEQDSTYFPGRPQGDVYHGLLDHQGNFWAVCGGRLARIQFSKRQFFTMPIKPEGLNAEPIRILVSLLEDRKGHFRFFGIQYEQGLVYLDKKTGRTQMLAFPNQRDLPLHTHFAMQIIQTADDAIWVLSMHHLYRFWPEKMQLTLEYSLDIPKAYTYTHYFTQMAEDKEGNLWLGSSASGIIRWNPITKSVTHFTPNEDVEGALPTNVVGLIKADGKGRIWFGSRDRTAYGYYQPKEGRFYYLDGNGRITKEQTTLRPGSFFTDQKGDIWACSEQGAFHFDCSGEHPRCIKKYTIADGLPSDNVPWGVEDRQGQIWLVSGRRLCRINLATGAIQQYGQQEGYSSYNTGMGLLDDGSIYLRDNSSYKTFHPDSLRTEARKSLMVLTSFKVNDKEQYQGSGIDQVQDLLVPDEGRFFSFEFTALDFVHPELCRYEYQLEGFDKDWVNADNRHFVNYTNIPAGKYQFKVKLKDAPDNSALVVPVHVRVAFYKTNWFWSMVLLLIAGVIAWLIYRRQTGLRQMRLLKDKAQLLEKEKALMQYETLRQQLNPHFLFNSLTSLSSLITIDTKAAAIFLDSLSKTYRYILKSSERESVPLSEELKFAESFVSLQKTRFGDGFQVHFKVEEEDLLRKVVPVTLQNLIENAIKHNIIDEESPLVIDVFTEKGYLIVRNNLQKKKFVETSNKRGLANLKSFYRFLSNRSIEVTEDAAFYTIKIPLI